MRSEVAKRMLKEMSQATKDKARAYAHHVLSKSHKDEKNSINSNIIIY